MKQRKLQASKGQVPSRAAVTKKKELPSFVDAEAEEEKNADISWDTERKLWGFFIGCLCLMAGLMVYGRVEPGAPGSNRPVPPPVRRSHSAYELHHNEKITIDCGDYPVVGEGSCSPPTRCGRLMVEDFVPQDDLDRLKDIASRAMEIGGGGAGGPDIYEIISGAVSQDVNFIDVYATPAPADKKITVEDVEFIAKVVAKVRKHVSRKFSVKEEELYLASPAFFSRIFGNRPAKTLNDEYWHPHIDTLQYGSFTYTNLLYLNDQGVDFEGGAFQFIDRDYDGNAKSKSLTIVRPQAGRLSSFTSGPENRHQITPVSLGIRFAFTIAFTCDERQGVSLDSVVKRLRESQ